jgi:cell wall-associated NlpC family hydrolase
MSIRILISSFLFSILLFSCTPSVRFSSNNNRKIPESKISIIEKKKQYDILSSNEKKEKIVDVAEQWIGVPYQYGGDSFNGVDCSAFVQNVYSEMGLAVPRTAQEQYDYTDKINKSGKSVGDLVFFKKDTGISHVGIYVGNNEIIHASSSRGVVRESLDTHWLEKVFAGIGRVPK